MDKDHSLLLTHHIKPDYGFYVQADDRLLCIVHSSVASLVVRFGGYFLAYDGTVKQYAIEISPTSDRAATTATQFFGEGFILSCTAQLVTGNANRGQCYVRARVQRGSGTTALPIARLMAGYLTDDFTPSFPYGRIEGPLEGPGMIRSITGTDPAAGAEISESVPTGARWRMDAARWSFVTDGTVANRNPVVVIDDGTTIIIEWGSNNNPQTATITRIWDLRASGFAETLGSTRAQIHVDRWPIMMAGYRLRTVTNSLQAGDNYGAPQLQVEEWLEA